ncbi:MAG: SEC-C domain-containing protein [Chloroflexi bacterium]|nr:SEC-C domain-containing protein [Chloroflexota bacterium]MBP8055553.1 SEC-C domain-containing protein [Chloroflexota bacterium]
MSDLPGRNDPCYCGSGKKYKQCHMKQDQDSLKERLNRTAAVQFVRRDLLKFARDERFAERFAAALPLYWNDYYTLETADEMSEDEALRFFDWYLFDYSHTNTDGSTEPRLINQYAQEKGDDLATAQQPIIAAWQMGMAASGYELRGYEGQVLNLRDIVTGEDYEVYTSGGRGLVEIGEVILIRILPSTEYADKAPWSYSTTGAYLPKDEIGDVAQKLLAAKEAYLAEHPNATHEDFMRRHNIILIHHALEQAKLQGRPPVARLDPTRPDRKQQKVVQQLRRFRR